MYRRTGEVAGKIGVEGEVVAAVEVVAVADVVALAVLAVADAVEVVAVADVLAAVALDHHHSEGRHRSLRHSSRYSSRSHPIQSQRTRPRPYNKCLSPPSFRMSGLTLRL
jgi:hypothetical protein